MPRTIDISDLPAPVAEALESIVRAYRQQASNHQHVRPTGWARELLPELPPSFFEPLPDDILQLFEDKRA